METITIEQTKQILESRGYACRIDVLESVDQNIITLFGKKGNYRINTTSLKDKLTITNELLTHKYFVISNSLKDKDMTGPIKVVKDSIRIAKENIDMLEIEIERCERNFFSKKLDTFFDSFCEQKSNALGAILGYQELQNEELEKLKKLEKILEK